MFKVLSSAVLESIVTKHTWSRETEPRQDVWQSEAVILQNEDCLQE
jgi:hypothetical protein